MVSFAIFNELSLPFSSQDNAEQGFVNFIKLLSEINQYGFTKIRIEKHLRNVKITDEDWLEGFFAKINNRLLKDRIRILLSNQIINIEVPLIKDDEIEDDLISPVYLYNSQHNFGGLACADYWNTLALSFNSASEWNTNYIGLRKDSCSIQVRHASDLQHLNSHQDLFTQLEKELKLGITQKNFWERRQEIFSSIEFLEKIKNEVENLDAQVFKQFVSILRDIETRSRPLSELDVTGESTTTNNDPRLRAARTFTHQGEKLYFEKHIKNLPYNYRIHYLEIPTGILIGYIGPHLPT